MKRILISAAGAALFTCTTPALAAPTLAESFSSGPGAFSVASATIRTYTLQDYKNCCGITGSAAALDNTIVSFAPGNVANEGSMFTLLQTAANTLYTLTFRAGALGSGTTSLSYAVGGIDGTVDLTANNNADTTLQTYSYNFLGTGLPTSLAFSSHGESMNIDAILDDVSVTAAVPEPATWAMMLVGFGAIGGTLRRRHKVAARVHFA